MDGGQDDLDGLIRRVDPDRWLASRFIGDRQARADVIALYAYDHELARARQAASNPLIAEIRLTWWREALDEIFEGRPVRRHPAAEALAAAVRRAGLPRAPLEAMIDGWIEVLETPALDAEAAVRWADSVQGALMRLSVLVLDAAADPEAAASAGRAWGLVLARRAGLAGADVVGDALGQSLAAARVDARRLSVEAFPAALAVALARFDLAGVSPGPLRRRVALVMASASGRL